MSGTERRTKDEWLTWVNAQPDSAWGPPDSQSIAVIYSGFQGQNSTWAAQDCQRDSRMYTINDTEAGGYLHTKLSYGSDSGLSWAEASEVWGAASGRFAQNVKGPVETQILSSDKNDIARATELPIDLNNANVTSINGLSRQELAGMNETDRYYKICEAEIGRARDLALETGDSRRVDSKEAGFDALRARDQAWAAQAMAAGPGEPAVPLPSEKVQFDRSLVEKGLLNDNPRKDGQQQSLPRDIPSPNPSYGELDQLAAKAPSHPVANDNSPSMPSPDDGVPPPTSRRRDENDHSFNGP